MAKSTSDVMAGINKDRGAGSVFKISDITLGGPRIPTGILGVDQALGGGIPKGTITEFFGLNQCLDGDTHVQYAVRDADGKMQNSKGGSIEHLYRRFHHLSRAGKGNYQRPQSENSHFTAPSVGPDGVISHNRIGNVVDSGVKQCYELKTESRVIVASADHRFLTPDFEYVKLSDLSVGIAIMAHNSTPLTLDKPKLRAHRNPEWMVKSHPDPECGIKKVNGSIYRRLAAARGCAEAALNGLSPAKYRALLNTGDATNLVFVPLNMEVHHINENTTDDSVSNLAVLTRSEHRSLHSKAGRRIKYIATPEQIISIEPVGERHTYDIEMADSPHNFVAGGLVVHNSGKTSLSMRIVAEAQRSGDSTLFIDAENAMNEHMAAQQGIDMEALWLSQPSTGEEALEIVRDSLDADDLAVIVVDSVASLVPQRVLAGDFEDSHVGIQARMLSQALNILQGDIKQRKKNHPDVNIPAIIFINQIRSKIGSVAFGPQTTTPGGMALPFYASIRLEVTKIETLKKTGEDPYGHKVRVKAVKNKTFRPFLTSEYDIIYDGVGDLSAASSLLDMGIKKGVVLGAKNWLSLSTGEKLGNGRMACLTALATDDGLRETLTSLVLEEQ